jgi:thymidylate synthase (FAD)
MANAKLIDITNDAENQMVYCARVSNPSNQSNFHTGGRLLKYCLDHRHWSVFEMAYATVEVETERDISAQILRHRSFCFQEFSTRYAKTSKAEPFEIRRQDNKNRQSSHNDLPEDVQSDYTGRVQGIIDDAWTLYEEMITNGIARETARRILPMCTPTTFYMSGNVRSWIHYIEVRTQPGTQKEHRDVAIAIRNALAPKLPIIADVLGWETEAQVTHFE